MLRRILAACLAGGVLTLTLVLPAALTPQDARTSAMAREWGNGCCR